MGFAMVQQDFHGFSHLSAVGKQDSSLVDVGLAIALAPDPIRDHP